MLRNRTQEKKRFHLSKSDSWISIQHIQLATLARKSLKWGKIHQLIHIQAEYKENNLLSGIQRHRRPNRDGAGTARSWLTTQVTHHHSLKRGRILQGSHNSCFNQEKSHHCLDPSLREGICSGGKGRQGQGRRCGPAPKEMKSLFTRSGEECWGTRGGHEDETESDSQKNPSGNTEYVLIP